MSEWMKMYLEAFDVTMVAQMKNLQASFFACIYLQTPCPLIVVGDCKRLRLILYWCPDFVSLHSFSCASGLRCSSCMHFSRFLRSVPDPCVVLCWFSSAWPLCPVDFSCFCCVFWILVQPATFLSSSGCLLHVCFLLRFFFTASFSGVGR